MKLIVLIAAMLLTGCAVQKAVVPALDGKPRVKINKQQPPLPAKPA